MKERTRSAIPIVIAALIVAAIASAQSVGINLTKNSTLSGTGSSGSALAVNTTTLAGSGLDKTSTTLLVGQGSGIAVDADSVRVNIAGATCSAGEAVTALSAIGTGTCSAFGDITSVVAGNGLTGGATSGAATLDVAASSDFTVGADSFDFSNDVDFPGIVGYAIDQNGYGGIDTTINNLDPGGEAIVSIQCGDDTSTEITGIDATGYASGDVLYFVNSGTGLGDAQSCILTYEDSSSTAANRFVTPDRRNFKVGGSSGVLLVRAPTLDGSGVPTADIRWHVISQTEFERVSTQDLQFFPPCPVGLAAAISGSFNDWSPTCDQYQSYTVFGVDGSDRTWKNHTLIKVGTDAAGATITGMYWGGDIAFTDLDNGTVKVIINYGPGDLTFKDGDVSSASAVDNRISTPCDADLVLRTNEAAVFVHAVRWTLVSAPTSHLCPARVVVTPTDATNSAIGITMVTAQNNGLEVSSTAAGQTPASNFQRGIFAQITGSFDATAANQSAFAIVAQNTATKSAGPNALTNYAFYGDATGGLVNYSGFFDRGTFRQQTGDAVFNGDGTGVFIANGTAFDCVGNCTLGNANTDLAVVWGHVNAKGTAPSISCDGASEAITNGTDRMGTFNSGTGTTNCTITFSRTYTANQVACVVTARDGADAAGTTYTTSATALTFSAIPDGVFDYHCECIGTGCT